MSRPLATAGAAWILAILAATAGVLLPSEDMRLSLALFALAMGLGLLIGGLLVADGLRRRRARQRAALTDAQSGLERLEYLPSVTTATLRLQWRGARVQVTGGRRLVLEAAPGPTTVAAPIHPVATSAELTGSTYPRPASSTTQPRSDEAEARPRAS